VAGAAVSISGYPDVAVSDKIGNFVLPAHPAMDRLSATRAERSVSCECVSAFRKSGGGAGSEASVNGTEQTEIGGNLCGEVDSDFRNQLIVFH